MEYLEKITISIEKYEEDMETELAKEKKKEIQELFQNFNTNINLYLNYGDKMVFEHTIHELCKKGDVELLKIYLKEQVGNESKDMFFKIDKTNKTASLCTVKSEKEEIIIPRSFTHESTEYLITSVFSIHNNMKSIKFAEDSAVETIYYSAFYHKKIEEIYFPASLKELKDGWCSGTDKLTKIRISPSNDQFVFKDDKYLLGKSDKNNTEFDILLFASRDIKEISIPSNIKIISSFAFYECKNLTKVEIPTDSNLNTIGKNSFSESNIREIFIPPNVSKIGESAFSYCQNLIEIDIPTNSNLQSIERNAFLFSKIREIYLPASLKELKDGWCKGTDTLTKIRISPSNDQFVFKDDKYLLGKSDKNNTEFDVFQFASRDIKEISIPSNIKIISSSAFEKCENLTKVEIPTDSNLNTIGKNSFSESNIREIFIPPNVSKIGESAFYFCQQLEKVEIPANSNLQTIEKNAFYHTKIKEIFIPVNVSKIGDFAFHFCSYLTKIEISTNYNLQINGKYIFKSYDKFLIQQIFIPSSVLKKCKYSLYDCDNLIKVEIPTNDKKYNTEKELITYPQMNIPIDCSAILSLSIYNSGINIITKDFKAIVGVEKKNKINKTIDYDFTEERIKNDEKIYYPISCYKCNNYDFYMVSEVEKGIKTKLVKNGHFLNIGQFNPVAIYGGYINCAAIDLKGAILYIPNSYDESSFKIIEPKYLPKKEKAVNIACLINALYVLSSSGNLYMSKNSNRSDITFKQVEQFKNTNIIQISGISNHILVLTEEGKVYSKGQNLFGELGTGDKKDHLKKFSEITFPNQDKITSVFAGECHSFFLTSEGKVFECGRNDYNQSSFESSNSFSNVLPTETRFHSGVEFCISSYVSSVVCTGFDPEMSPNRRVKDEISILLFGCQKKAEILKAFINDNFENSLNDDDDNQVVEDYIVNLDVQGKVIKLILIDVKNIDSESKDYYQRAVNLIYFFDNSNQSKESFDELDKIYEESNQIWNNDSHLAFVNCINENSKKIKYEEIKKKYKCKVYEVGEDKDIENIDKPFYSFLPKIFKNNNEVIKIGKEYRNPFYNINNDHINIGLFSSKNVNKSELAFRYVYGDVYKHFYDDFITNFTENSLDKIVEIKNKFYEVSILDSTFINNKNEDFSSYYPVVQGIVLVFQIDLLTSSSDFINEINKFYKNAKDSVKGELNIIIALKVSANNEINDLYNSLFDKISQIEKKFESEVILFSVENGENVDELFYCLIRKIFKNKKQRFNSKEKKHKKKKTKAKTKIKIKKE